MDTGVIIAIVVAVLVVLYFTFGRNKAALPELEDDAPPQLKPKKPSKASAKAQLAKDKKPAKRPKD